MTDIVSSTYLGYLRSGHPHVVRANLSLIMPNTIYCGTVASEPDRGARTLTVTNVSGNIANVVAGMTVWIGAACGSFSKAKRRLRGRSGQVLTIDENPTDIALGDYVTVVDSREFWSIWPYVTETPPYTFYKDRDIAYSDQNLYPSPVAIAGPYRVGRLNTTTGLLTFALNASSSYAMAYGATISSYLWTCTGGTIASSTSAITSITFDTAGVYWLSLTVTDSNGKSHTTWRAYRVHDANDPAYTQFNVTSPLAQDWMSGGWRASLSLSDAYSLTDYPDGALALIWVDQTFNGVEAYYEDNVRFCGHFRRSTLREGLGSGEMAFDLETMDGLMTNRNMMSASLEYSTSPKTWYQMYRLTVARAIHHYLRWHTTIFDITDVYLPTDETTPLPAVDDFENGDIYGQLDNFAYNRSIFAKPLFDRHNRLWVKRDIHILGTADRAAVPNLVTLSLTDLQPTLEITVNGEPTVCHLVVSGGVRNSVDNTMTPIISQAPGEVPENEGATERPFDFQVIPTQEAANVLAGRAYAIVNRYLEEIRIKLAGNYGDIFECSPQYWVTLPALPNDRGLDLAGKYSVKAISVPLELTTGTAGCELVLVPDIASVDGIPGPYPPDVEEGNGGEEPPESPPWTPPAPPPPIDTTDISDIFVAIQDDVRSCNDMEGASISWVSKANGITGTIVDACTYYNDGTKNNACAATETKVYVTHDFQAESPTWEEWLDVETYTNADAGIPDGFEAPKISRVLACSAYKYVIVNDGVGANIVAYLIGEDILGTYCSEIGTMEDAVTSYTVKSADFSYSHVWDFTIAPFDVPLDRMVDDNTQSPWALAYTWQGSYYPGPGNTWEATVQSADSSSSTYNAADFGINPYTTGTDPWVPLVPVATVNSLLSVADRLAARAMLDDYFGTWEQAIGYPHEMPKEEGRAKFTLTPHGLGWGYPSTGTGTVTGTVYVFYNIPNYNMVKAIDFGKHDPKIVYVSLNDSGKIVRSIDGGRTWEDYITDTAAYDIECHEFQSKEDNDITFWSDQGRLYRTAGTSKGSSLYLETVPLNQPRRISSDPVTGWPIWAIASSTDKFIIRRDKSSTTTPDLGASSAEAASIVCRPGADLTKRRIYYLTADDIRFSDDDGTTFYSKIGDWSTYGGPIVISPFV